MAVTMAISIALPPISAAADTASGASSGTRLLNAIVASIDGQAVTLRDLEEFERTRAMFIPPKARDTRQKRLDALVQTRMYRLEYEYGGMEASDADVEKYITNVLEQTSSSREELVATLESLGLGWGDYFERMREEVLRLALINREVSSRVSVTPEEVERAWATDSSYDLPARVEIAQIYLPHPVGDYLEDKLEARRELFARLHSELGRESFADAARRHSTGPTAADGGLLGVFRRGSMSSEFEDVVSSLSEGEISRPFEAAGGLNMIHLVKEHPQGRVALDEARESIEKKLYNEAMDSRFQRFTAEDLPQRHYVRKMLGEVEELAAR
jgi:peptidyl-prolyl cis-trans isomerase SurA